MRAVAFLPALVSAIVAVAACSAAPNARSEVATGFAAPTALDLSSDPTTPGAVACCGPVAYSTEHTVVGDLGEAVPVTWSTGTGLVTLHQVQWDNVGRGEGLVGTRLMMEVTFEATAGTVNYGRLSWLGTDAAGRTFDVGVPAIADTGLHELPDAASLRSGQKDSGWSAFLIIDPPVPPIEIHLVEYETTTRLVEWTIDGPTPAVLGSMTTSVPFTPRRGPALDCRTDVLGMNFDAPEDFTGQASPVAAAEQIAASGVVSGFAVAPDAIWTLGPADDSGVYVTTDAALVHAVQSPTNQTWLIDEVQYCGP